MLRYSVGNENNPGDPWGRSELAVDSDGTVRLEHHFSRRRETGSWGGVVAAGTLDTLRNALRRAGFPATPDTTFVPGATLRVLTLEENGAVRRCVLDWHRTASLPGYAEAFAILDGLIRDLSDGAVTRSG